MSVKTYLTDVIFSTWFKIFSSKSFLLIGVVEFSDNREVEFLSFALIFSLDTSSGMGSDMILLEFVLFMFELLLLPEPADTKLDPSSAVVFDFLLDLNFLRDVYDVLCFKLMDKLEEDRLLLIDKRRSPPVVEFIFDPETSLENSDLWKSVNEVLLRTVEVEEVGEFGPMEEAMEAFLRWLKLSVLCGGIMFTFSDCVDTDFGNSEEEGEPDFFQNFHFPESELPLALVAVVFVAVVACEYIEGAWNEFLCDVNCIELLFLS